MKAAFRYIAVPEEAYRIAGPHRVIPMDLWAMAHGSRLRTVRVTERQWEPEVSRRHARTVLSDFVTAGLLLVAERGDRGSVYRVVDASTGTFGEDVYHSAYHNADHNCPEPTSEPDTNADRIADHARIDPRARPTIPYLTLPSDQGELRVETTPSHEAVVPQAAAPAALGPADPASDEPDWDALLTAVPLTYDEEADDDRGAVDPEADSPPVDGGAESARRPAGDGEAVEDDLPRAVAARGLRAAALGGDAPAGAVLTLPLATATQPPPATRTTDVDALWEAWRSYGTVRGRPNDKRRKLMETAIKKHGLSTMLDLLAAAHTGAGDYWRHLQGATPRNDTPYLSPETLLNGRRDERVERAAAWVAAGRPTHDVAETRVEARAQAVARPAKERALAAWDRVPEFAGMTLDQAKDAMGRWPAENQRAMLAGLDAVGGLSTLGRLDSFARQRKRGDFVRGVVEALGGRLTEAELREVG